MPDRGLERRPTDDAYIDYSNPKAMMILERPLVKLNRVSTIRELEWSTVEAQECDFWILKNEKVGLCTKLKHPYLFDSISINFQKIF